MFNRTAIAGIIAAALLFSASANAAHYISILAPDNVTEGDQFDITIVGDFLSLGFFGGGVQFLHDPSVLQLDSYSTPLNVGADSCPGGIFCPDDSAGVFSIVWENFATLTDLIPPDAGPTLMATITATALAPTSGTTALSMIDFSLFTGGWFGAGFTSIDAPALRPASIQINAVPLPAAVWMMIGGLGALARFRRSN